MTDNCLLTRWFLGEQFTHALMVWAERTWRVRWIEMKRNGDREGKNKKENTRVPEDQKDLRYHFNGACINCGIWDTKLNKPNASKTKYYIYNTPGLRFLLLLSLLFSQVHLITFCAHSAYNNANGVLFINKKTINHLSIIPDVLAVPFEEMWSRRRDSDNPRNKIT